MCATHHVCNNTHTHTHQSPTHQGYWALLGPGSWSQRPARKGASVNNDVHGNVRSTAFLHTVYNVVCHNVVQWCLFRHCCTTSSTFLHTVYNVVRLNVVQRCLFWHRCTTSSTFSMSRKSQRCTTMFITTLYNDVYNDVVQQCLARCCTTIFRTTLTTLYSTLCL